MKYTKDDLRYCVVPMEDESDMEWNDPLMLSTGITRNIGTHFSVAYDGRKPKPECLAPYDDFSRTEAKAAAQDPESPWHIPPDPNEPG